MLSKDNSAESDKRGIDLLFGSKARVDVLWALIRHAEGVNHGLSCTDLVKLTGHPLQAVQRVLERLCSPPLELVFFFENITPPEKFDLVTLERYKSKEQAREEFERRGRGRYLLPRDHPWVPALKLLLENAVGALDVLRVELNHLPGIDIAFVYGSFATSEQRPGSDVDLIVIGSQILESITDPISEIEDRIGREVQVLTYTPAEWREKVNAGDHFAVSLMEAPKVFLVGDNAKLEEIIG